MKPSLSLPNIRVGIDRKDMFQFKAAYTTFIGREQEIQQLDEFVRVDNDYPIRWLMVTGPGGIGKSRLALEYCQKIRQQGFDAGFLTAENLYRLQDYQPEKPTLIVIDYVAAQSNLVSSVILDLHRRQTTNNPLPRNKNLRLLLLERDISYDTNNNNGNWWKDFKKNAEVWSCGFLLNEHNQPILSLSGFNDDKLWQIIEEVYQKSKSEIIPFDREEILTQLYRLDPRKRPLFAFFVGVALADGNYGNLREWNVHNLLDSLLAREKKEFWQPHESYERKEPKLHENLLAMVTLTQGLPQDTISEFCESIAKEGKWLPPEPDIDLYKSMAQIREDEQTDETVWEGLQPDLLGEYFVLIRIEDWLHSINKNKAKKEVIALIQSAWDTSPEEVKDFIDRTLRDYTELANTKAYQILLTTPPSTKTRKEVWNARGLFLQYATVNPYTSTGELANPLKYYGIIVNETALPQDETIKALLILKQAEATFNMTMFFSSKGNIEQAEVYYKKIEGLFLKYNTPDIAFVQAQAANNLIVFFGLLQTLEKAEEYFNGITELLKAFRTPDIALAQANAVTNITAHFGNATDSEHIKKYYDKIHDLLDEFKMPEIALQKAKAAGNLITYSRDKTKFKYAEHLYYDIETLFSIFKLPEIKALQARAAYSLAERTGRKEEFEKAEWYFAQGKAFSKNLTTPLIISVHTNAALNLTVHFADSGAFKKGEQYYRELTESMAKYESQETIISVAKAAVFLCLKTAQFGQQEHAEIYYKTIETLLSKYRNTAIIKILVEYTETLIKIIIKDGWLVLAKTSQQLILFYSNKLFSFILYGI